MPIGLKHRLAVVLNPNAGRRPVDSVRVREVVGSVGHVAETENLSELNRVVRELLDDGVEVIAISGGDGTLNWVLNEALAIVKDPEALPAFLPTNGGTIDFVARKVGVRGDAIGILSEVVARLRMDRSIETRSVDSLELTGALGSGEAFHRLGFALAAGGIGQRFFSKYYSEPRLGAPAIVSVVSRAVASFAAARVRAPVPQRWLDYGRDVFRPTRARVWIDGEELRSDEQGAIHAGAFDVSLGGVFRVFPLASAAGVIHFQAGAIVPMEMIRALPSLARGDKIPSEYLVEKAGQEMRIEATGEEPLAPILDGESFENLRTLTVRPGPRIRIARIEA